MPGADSEAAVAGLSGHFLLEFFKRPRRSDDVGVADDDPRATVAIELASEVLAFVLGHERNLDPVVLGWPVFTLP